MPYTSEQQMPWLLMVQYMGFLALDYKMHLMTYMALS